MTLEKFGYVALGFLFGVYATAAGMTYAAMHYDDNMRMIDALMRKYGPNLERKPSP